MYKILITDGGYSHSLEIIRSLNKEGYKLDCIGHPLCLSSFSKSLNKLAFNQAFFKVSNIDQFLLFLDREKYDFLIPIGAQSVYLVNKFRKEISKKVVINLAPSKSINICLSKNKLLKLSNEIGIPIPKIYKKKDLIQIIQNKEKFNKKIVVKPSSELSNSKVIYSSDIQRIEKIIRSKEELLIQEYINGYGVGFFAIYDNGTLKKFFMHKRIRENPPSGGSSVCAESIYDENLFFYGKKLLDKLNWHGVAMVEFKKEYKTNKLFLMEVNPKFWASHDLAISSGINFAKEYLEIMPKKSSLKDNLNYEIKYLLNNRFQWLARDLSSSILRPLRLLNVLNSFIILKSKNNLYLKDPLPTLYLIIYAFFSPLAKSKVFKSIYSFLSRIKNYGLKTSLIRTYSELTGIPIFRFSSITNQISIGQSPSKLGLYLLNQKRYKFILNLRSEYKIDKSIYKNFEIKHIPVIEFTSPTFEQLEEGANFINCAIIKNKKIYIHCREGISRAPCFLIAYFIRYHKLNFHDALNLILKKRYFINILPNQEARIKEYEEFIKNPS